MVKTTKDREDAPPPSAARGGDITVMNLYRNQPLSFHYLGGSVRLGPLESRKVSRGALSSPELAHLRSIGAVSVEDAAPAPAAGRGERHPHAAATPKEH
jgi:hypothetical protein